MKVTIQIIAIRTWCFYTKYVTVEYPDIVQRYNQFIDGTDLYDMFMSLSKIDHKSEKYYQRICFQYYCPVLWEVELDIRDMITAGFH